MIDPEKVIPHPKNPRHGDVGAIAESIRINGFWGSVIIQKSTGFCCAGNHRVKAAIAAGLAEIPAQIYDIDDDQALRILIADNRYSDIAANDNELLAELLADLAEADSLEGTGWDTDDVDGLLRLVNQVSLGEGTNAYEEWVGMPDYEQNDRRSAFRTTVHFLTEDDANEFFSLIERPKLQIMWWPEREDFETENSRKAAVFEDEDDLI